MHNSKKICNFAHMFFKNSNILYVYINTYKILHKVENLHRYDENKDPTMLL